MELTVVREKNVVVVSVRGNMDAVTAPAFEKRLSELISKGDKVFLIDFSGLDYISSAGLRSMLVVAGRLKTDNSRMVFSGLKGHVEEVFKIAGFYAIFEIFESKEAALRCI